MARAHRHKSASDWFGWIDGIKSMVALDRSGARRAAAAGTWLIAVLGIAGAWLYGGPSLRAYAEGRLARASVEVVLPPLPGWLRHDHEGDPALERRKADILRQITEAAIAECAGGPFSHADLERMRAAIEATGWFDRVDRIIRTSAERIEVRGAFVEPFTLIEDGSGNHLVDRTGRLLPLHLASGFPLRSAPMIVGARFARPSVGDRWEGRDVEAGLRLVEQLCGRAWSSQVVAVNVADYTTSEALWLETDRGARLLWGRAPGEERGREVPARQKIAYLEYFFEESGRIDRNLAELDLTLDVVYAR